MMGFSVRLYREEDQNVLAELFYQTVHTVNAADYTDEQIDAWAPEERDMKRWNESLMNHDTVVAEKNGQIIGFGDMDENGYLDRLYVHKDFQRKGIASAICDKLENQSAAEQFETHASITAKGFFEKRGYKVVKEQQVERKGVLLTNFIMCKSKKNR